MPLVPIDSIEDPRVADYARVREAEVRKGRYDAPGGLFVAEGELVVRRLVASRYRMRSMLLTHSRLRTLEDLVASMPDDLPVYLVDQDTMNGVVGFNIHRGVLAIGERGPEPALPDLIASARCVVILEDLVNHDNVGGVFRNVAALGAGCAAETVVLLSPRCADPLYRKAIRVSMGAALQVPFGWLDDWPGGLNAIRDAKFQLLAMTPVEGSVDIERVSAQMSTRSSKFAIMLGSEGPGLSSAALATADLRVRIDMPGRDRNLDFVQMESKSVGTNSAVDSLNVSVACAIALHRLFPLTSPPNSG